MILMIGSYFLLFIQFLLVYEIKYALSPKVSENDE